MRNTARDNSSNGGDVGGAGGDEQRRPYVPPRVLSSEPLEMAAATCDNVGNFGKTVPVQCLTLGS